MQPRPITDPEVDEQLEKLAVDRDFQGHRGDLLKFLVQCKRKGRYTNSKLKGETLLAEFYSEKQITVADAADAGKHVAGKLIEALNHYYANRGRYDETVIEIRPGRGPAYEPSFRRRSELPLESDPSISRNVDIMEPLRKGPIHSYHLTRERDTGEPMWAYKVLTFSPHPGNPNALIADAANLPKPGDSKERYVYQYEAVEDHGHLLLRSYRRDSSDDITVQLYPHEGLGEHNDSWCGVGLLSRTWRNNPASTICILSDKALQCASGAVDGQPISDPATVRSLEAEWERRARTLRLMRLPVARSGVQGVTIYPNWNQFPELLAQVERGPETESEDLRIATIAFTPDGIPEDKVRDLATKGVRVRILLTDPMSGQSLVAARNKLRAKHGDGETPAAALKALCEQIDRLRERRENIRELKARSSLCKGELDFRLSDVLPYGFVAHCSRFIVLGLFVATRSYGSGPMIVLDYRDNVGLWNTLKAEWHERWADARIVDDKQPLAEQSHSATALAQQLITATRLLREFEARVPDDAEIWIASHDLSTVGDESQFATLVREVVRRNAARGVNYTYLCPRGLAGDSRLENLRDCFQDAPGKLKIHQIPRDKFSELTLMRSHFMSFNPLDPSPAVYMQVPLPTAEKAWVQIDRQSALRVIERMKDLHSHYQADDGP